MKRIALLLLVELCMVGVPLPARADSTACWTLIFDAIRASAASQLPQTTSYNERGVLTEDGVVRMRENIDVSYRSDGLAFITDPATGNSRHATNYLEPGPPLLGPYGKGRVAWIGTIAEEFPYPLVASVRNKPSQPCENLGLESYNGLPAYHIVLPEASQNAASLRAIWIDPTTLAVRKTIVGGLLWETADRQSLAYPSFEVEFQQLGNYNVVRHVTWKYRMRVYSQYTTIFGEYYFNGYSFS